LPQTNICLPDVHPMFSDDGEKSRKLSYCIIIIIIIEVLNYYYNVEVATISQPNTQD